ncbi:SLC13 family permease [Treponema sp.]|uniref:SLC13 family permease n=1 Tax=Treponema sp. TaxID=166 RepID=UPI0025E2A18F|nr:SLC13 family permease [Treponema sp.]MCR5217838.1 hypothetical protein [Treponema sp.]
MQMKWLVLGIAAVMYLLAVVFKKKRIYFSSFAAFLIIILGMIFPGQIFALPKDLLAMNDIASMRLYAPAYSLGTAIPYNLMMIIAGLMIINALMVYSRIPEKAASLLLSIVKLPSLSLTMLFIFTAILSAFMGPVAAMTVSLPVILSLSNQLKFNPAFFLLSLGAVCMMEASAFYFASPASFIFADSTAFSLGNFFIYSGKISLFFIAQLSLLVTSIFFFIYFSRKLKGSYFIARVKIVSIVPLILYAAVIAVLIFCSLTTLRFECTSGSAVLGIALAGLLWFFLFEKKTLSEVLTFLKEMDWDMFVYIGGVFVIAGALKKSGVYNDLAGFLLTACGSSRICIYLVVFFVSLLAGAFLEGIPFIIMLLPVIKIAAASYAFKSGLLSAAMLAGLCCGASLTPFSSVSGQYALGLLKRESYEIKSLDWIKNVLPAGIIAAASYGTLLWFLWK